jgi:hypothetical protein
VLKAERSRPTDREAAHEAARLATELDPQNEAARALLDVLAAPAPSSESAPLDAAGNAPPRRQVRGTRPTPAPSSSAPAALDAGAATRPASSAAGGRWL